MILVVMVVAVILVCSLKRYILILSAFIALCPLVILYPCLASNNASPVSFCAG